MLAYCVQVLPFFRHLIVWYAEVIVQEEDERVVDGRELSIVLDLV